MTETPADLCQQLLRACDRATLATRMADDPNQPYASLVMAACAMDGAPLLFLSDLAEHTKNLNGDSRASLMVDGTAGMRDPLAGRRITLQGQLHLCEDAVLLDRYCRRHPSAGMYRSFKDFNLYQMAVDRVHIVAGFGYIHWVDGEEVIKPQPGAEALVEAEDGIVSHMNADHSDVVGLIANRLLGHDGVGWRMTGIDPAGMDLRLGGAVARMAFASPVHDAGEARQMLVSLAEQARAL